MSPLDSPLSEGLHVTFIKGRLPKWLEQLTTADIPRLHRARDPLQALAAAQPELFASARPALRRALLDSQAGYLSASQTLAKTLASFKTLTDFATPLLNQALRDTFGLAPDVNKTQLFHLRAPNRADAQSLLQAALRNFEADEPFDEVALQETSALAPEDALEQHRYDETEHYPFGRVRYRIRDKLAIKPEAFAQLCRTLDLGTQYQDHIGAVFETPATADEVRRQTIAANKAGLRLQAHIARLQANLDETAYATLLKILDGQPGPMLDGYPVVYSQLTVLGAALSDVLIIGSAPRKPGTTLVFPTHLPVPPAGEYLVRDTRIIVYIPGDPASPVKEYPSLKAFAQALAVKLRSPTYQRFFAGFLPQDESANFFRRLRRQLKVYRWNPSPKPPGPGYNPDAFVDGIFEEVWNDELDLHPDETFHKPEIFSTLYDRHLERIKANARLLAVPTAEVDHKAWIERLKHYAEWGLNVLNVAAFFVPGLGEVMLAVTAAQLTYEVYQGVEAWQVGDADEAWQHLASVLQNVVFMAALGAVAARAPVVKASAFVDGLHRVKLPFGETRLWNADLSAYKSAVMLPPALKPNALGQYEVGGKTYIRLQGQVYEKTFDATLNQWRIKHPSDPNAYQPVLSHNHAGAWRHRFERPHTWDRLTLLRRIGPSTDAFSDAQLLQVADISGVDDDALRRMHSDQKAPPAQLAETLKQFRIDRQVHELIDQARAGQRVPDNRYNYVPPLVVDMPRWPRGRCIEVFDGPGLTGKSSRWGTSVGGVKPVIQVTHLQVSSSQLPELILAALDEPEITGLLGGEGARVGAERVAVFREQIADFLQTQKATIFDSIARGTEPVVPALEGVRRSFRGLSTAAAREVLANATPAEHVHLSQTKRLPLKMAERARILLQQDRLSRACAGLYLESLASTDSDRLALHALEHLAGWSDAVRLEVRETGVEGPLLDSIGSETAPQRKYLVKHDNQFQAFDDNGNALNSVPRHGRNLFASILHALPDGARGDLGLPHVGQSGELQKALAEYAVGHRETMSRALGQQPIKLRFKRLQPGYTGYVLSGRGAGFPVNPQWVPRVRDIYPQIDHRSAIQFVQGQSLAGQTDQQMFSLLSSRQSELERLQGTLQQWVGAHEPTERFQATVEQSPERIVAEGLRLMRRALASELINCWRSTPYRGVAVNEHLDLSGVENLPRLEADFSHVVRLTVNAADLEGPAGAALLEQFPSVSRLSVSLAEGNALPPAIARNAAITALHVHGDNLAYSAALQQQLNGMAHLEHLSLRGTMEGIDVSELKKLKSLDLTFCQLTRWPTGVLDLPQLEALRLDGNPIASVPAPLFVGHERLWRGLRLGWSRLDHASFMSVYRYLFEHPAHLADVQSMTEMYRVECLDGLLNTAREHYPVGLRAPGISVEAMLDEIGTLRQAYADLVRELGEWKVKAVRVERYAADRYHREDVADRLLACWRNGLLERFGDVRERPPVNRVLYLSGGRLSDLPHLPGGAFPHIRSLSLSGLSLTEPELSTFLRKFPQVETLDLSRMRLHDLPSAIEGMGQLKALELQGNYLTVTAEMQARLNQLTALERLDLSRNRLGTLDVSALRGLKSLNVSATAIVEWPTGVLDLPHLQQLNVGRSGITTVPAVEQPHQVRLVATANLRGCPLTDAAFSRRDEIIARFSTTQGSSVTSHVVQARTNWGEREYYPAPDEELLSSSVLPQLSPEPLEGEPSMSAPARLRLLDPAMGEREAQQIVDRLRSQHFTSLQIDARLLAWRQEYQAFRSALNTWIDIKPFQLLDERVTPTLRRRAADAILSVWRQENLAHMPARELTLDLSRAHVGDLPALPATLEQVTSLSLNMARISEQGSNDFLKAFPNLRHLDLGGNGLDQLPDAVSSLQHLVQLDVSNNYLTHTPALQQRLGSLPELQRLNLGWNSLEGLDFSAFTRLESLDLRSNQLTQWPHGVLQAPELKYLDLRNNQLTSIPEEALQGHDPLMRGTDLRDNLLSRATMAQIYDYWQDTHINFRFTSRELERGFEGADTETTSYEVSEADSDSEPEDVTEQEAHQLDRWLGSAETDAPQKQLIWRALKAREGHQHFFSVIAELKETRDFTTDRRGLTARVWRLLEAAHSDDALRELLFAQANADYTCGDGRMLNFTDLTLKALEFNALKNVEAGQEGPVLLRLGKGLFRLDKVEALAREVIRRKPRIDPAEIRMAYRVGLAERLQLPEQPKGMLYVGASGVTPADLDVMFAQVTQAEQGEELLQDLIARGFWSDHLKIKYRSRFVALQARREAEHVRLENLYPDFGERYREALTHCDLELQIEAVNLTLELTRLERTEIGQ